MSRPATNVKVFFQRINDHGLDKNSLIIGLRAKERELKVAGPFFFTNVVETAGIFCA